MGNTSSQPATQQATQAMARHDHDMDDISRAKRATPSAASTGDEIQVSQASAKKKAVKQAAAGDWNDIPADMLKSGSSNAPSRKRRKMQSGDSEAPEEDIEKPKKRKRSSVKASELAKLQAESDELLGRKPQPEQAPSSGIRRKKRAEHASDESPATAPTADEPVVEERAQRAVEPRKRKRQAKETERLDVESTAAPAEQLLRSLEDDVVEETLDAHQTKVTKNPMKRKKAHRESQIETVGGAEAPMENAEVAADSAPEPAQAAETAKAPELAKKIKKRREARKQTNTNSKAEGDEEAQQAAVAEAIPPTTEPEQVEKPKKRKRPTGRPSGITFAPAEDREPEIQASPEKQVEQLVPSRPASRRVSFQNDSIHDLDPRWESAIVLEAQKMDAERLQSRSASIQATKEDAAAQDPNERVVNPVGRPGPRRRKSSTLMSAPANEQPSAKGDEEVKSAAAQLVNPVGRPGPRKRKKPTAAGASAVEQPEVKVATEIEPRSSRRVNLVGRPGPGRKRQKKSPTVPNAIPTEETQVVRNSQDQILTAAKAKEPDNTRAHEGSSRTDQSKRRKQAKNAKPQISSKATRVPEKDAQPGVTPDQVLTPPESPPHAQADHGVDATDQVRQWLGSQEDGAERTASPEVSRKKRKRVSHAQSDDEDDFQPPVEDLENSELEGDAQDLQQKKMKEKVKKYKKTSDRQRTKSVGQLNSGPFTDEEKQIADQVLKDQADIFYEGNEYNMKCQIIDWLNMADEIKVAFQDALPRRTKMALRRFCQRRYHVMKTGPWTAEDDEQLRKAYTENPDQWTSISDLVDRRPGDCRDRWRNYLMYDGTLETGPWSQEEEQALVDAVEDCIKTFKKKAGKKDKALINDRERLEQMLNWKVVAEKLGGRRSIKRCNEKWQKLKHRDATADQPRGNHNPATLPTGISQNDGSKRLRAVERQYQSLEVGDFYDILKEIYTAIDDHSRVYHDDTTFWSVVALKNKGSRFSSALRRRAYYDGLSEFKDSAEEGTIAATAKLLAQEIERTWSQEALRENRKYKVDQIGKDREEANRAQRGRWIAPVMHTSSQEPQQQPQPQATKSGRANNFKSEEYVLESDVESEQDSIDDQGKPQQHQQPSPDEQPNDEGSSGDDSTDTEGDEKDDEAQHEAQHEAQQTEQPPAKDISDDESNSEDDGSDSGDSESDSDVTEEIEVRRTAPTPQPEPEPEPLVVDEFAMSSVYSRLTTPELNPAQFMERCRNAGRRQHAEQLRTAGHHGWATVN